MRFITYIFLLFVLGTELSGQSLNETLTGKVSFASSQNIYVKFKSTEGISAGDTLFIYVSGKITPVLIVKNLSSSSCVCTSISAKSLSISQDVIARKKSISITAVNKPLEKKAVEISVPAPPVDTSRKAVYKKEFRQKINGSISAYSYSDFSNTGAKKSTQLRYNYTLDARNIGNSKFSIENYITFRHKLGDWSAVKSDVFNALKVYSLAVKYEPSKSTKISIGRTINYRISSIGAMDGLQVEQTLNKFTIGAVAGFRPDYKDYGFNSKLLQYGGYAAFDTKAGEYFSESSLAFMQQTNNMKTDRRFIYFQHTNSLLKNLFFFSTFEVDLYKVKNDLPQNTFDLTSLYLSLRYRISSNFSLTASYDQRKNVLFYETYKSLIDSVLQNERRQSYRLQANYRITKNITLGVETGYRSLKSDPRPSKNINGYLTYYQLPGLKVSLTLTGTYLESAYMTGKELGGDISKDLFNGKFQASMGYRYMDYILPESKLSILQNIGQINFFWQFSRKMSFSAYYEGTFEKHDKYNRIYLQIRKRF
jgi:hypothetical protein